LAEFRLKIKNIFLTPSLLAECLFIDGFLGKIIKNKMIFYAKYLFQPNQTKNKEMGAKN
jgi:hypothetical protein